MHAHMRPHMPYHPSKPHQTTAPNNRNRCILNAGCMRTHTSRTRVKAQAKTRERDGSSRWKPSWKTQSQRSGERDTEIRVPSASPLSGKKYPPRVQGAEPQLRLEVYDHDRRASEDAVFALRELTRRVHAKKIKSSRKRYQILSVTPPPRLRDPA